MYFDCDATVFEPGACGCVLDACDAEEGVLWKGVVVSVRAVSTYQCDECECRDRFSSRGGCAGEWGIWRVRYWKGRPGCDVER